MGLLDRFINMNPEQSQGLLAAAAQILQQSGDPRRPFGVGQAAGVGLESYQGSMDASKRRKLEEEQQAQLQKIRAMQIRDAESDFSNQETLRRRAADLAKFRTTLGGGQAGQAPMPAQAGMQDVPMPSATPMQSTPGMQMPQQAQPQAPQGAGGGMGGTRQAIAAQRLQQAQEYRRAGYVQEADAMEKQAVELMPKIKSWEKVMQGGKAMFAPYFEDGSSGAPVPLEVAEKLEKVDSGGRIDMSNPYTGAVVKNVKKEQTPDSLAQIRQQNARLGFDRSQAGKPVFSAELGGFALPPSQANPEGKFTALPGINKGMKMTEDQGKATGWLVQAENAYKNMMKVGIDKDGNPTAAAMPGINDAIGAVPGLGPLANTFRGADRQKFIQATSSLSEALLRAATGAGVNKDEAKQKVQELTPLYGEDPEVTKQKYAAIPLYLESLKVRAGPGALKAEGITGGASGDWDRGAGAGKVIDFGSLK